ncbi:uncharacterized protein LOC100193913 [Zea mays]|jgi:hypothetical protein|uniref:Uncharacterized protein n=1 Tax=Zea mays TaxID=4577 RepID=B4FGR3_MAIZE|nr:uncharacterized protein LOC100193913 [Zea mays]ACF81306.1 unknown [Zea mays]ACG48081.1 hypothetical protein [Zea mays]
MGGRLGVAPATVYDLTPPLPSTWLPIAAAAGTGAKLLGVGVLAALVVGFSYGCSGGAHRAHAIFVVAVLHGLSSPKAPIELVVGVSVSLGFPPPIGFTRLY